MQARDLHFLIVDDEEDFRQSMELLLGSLGYRTSLAASGDEALRLMETGLSPHVVLLDQRMPGLTGTETLTAMRARGLDTPAVLVSAARDVAEDATARGFDAAVIKPFSIDALIEKIRVVLAGREGRS